MIETSPRPSRDARPGLAEMILRGCLAIRCFALGEVHLWHPLERDSDIFELFYFDLGWPERLAQSAENWGMAASSAIGILSLFVPLLLWRSMRLDSWRRSEALLLAFLVFWELLLATCVTWRGGQFLSQLSFASHALRMGVPLALLLTDLAGTTPRLPKRALAVLRWATAITFLAHGWKAWNLSPIFVSMVLGGWQTLSATQMPQAAAETILKCIGAADLVCAALLVTVRWRWLVLCMSLWGAISALGRTLGISESNYPETMLRLIHAGGPLALFLEWHPSRKRQLESLSEPPSNDP